MRAALEEELERYLRESRPRSRLIRGGLVPNEYVALGAVVLVVVWWWCWVERC